MKIGERIRALRTQKMMTQTELAGNQITRNMLSCIENGTSLPSLPTLIYLAGRLGVPAGLLIAEEGNEFEFQKLNRMPDIRGAFAVGDWSICRDLCLSLGGTDDETGYLVCLCDYYAARDAFGEGSLRTAASLFERALEEISLTSYPLGWIAGAAGAYISYMREISPSFDSDADFPDDIVPDALGDPFCRYYAALRTFRTGETGPSLINRSAYGKSDFEEDHPYSEHIRAKTLMTQKKFSEAHAILRSLLGDRFAVPAPVLYFVFADLEACCSQLSDYKGAYEFANDKVAMLERFFR